jgi:hypothetical protein
MKFASVKPVPPAMKVRRDRFDGLIASSLGRVICLKLSRN